MNNVHTHTQRTNARPRTLNDTKKTGMYSRQTATPEHSLTEHRSSRSFTCEWLTHVSASTGRLGKRPRHIRKQHRTHCVTSKLTISIGSIGHQIHSPICTDVDMFWLYTSMSVCVCDKCRVLCKQSPIWDSMTWNKWFGWPNIHWLVV